MTDLLGVVGIDLLKRVELHRVYGAGSTRCDG
jgi:hypothetical protein